MMMIQITSQVAEMPSPEMALERFQPLVEGFTQAEPFLSIGGEHGELAIPMSEWGEDIADGLPLVVAAARAVGYTPDWLVLTSEAWERIFEGVSHQEFDEIADRIRKGDLEKAAKLGDSRVQEIVMICAKNAAGHGYMARARFNRTEAGVVWLDQDVLTLESGNAGGAMIEAMTEALKQ